jgi:Tfp pilus assembly protein PilF
MIRRAFRAHEQGELGKAEKLYAGVLQHDPSSFDALHLLGLLNHQRGRSEAAIRLIRTAVAADPRRADGLSSLGLVLHSMARREEALASYELALETEPDNLEVLNRRGVALMELGRPAEALADFDRVLALAPNHVDALGNRGNALVKLNRPQDALASYEAALKVAPGHARLLTNRAHALRRLDRPHEALLSASEAVAASPNFAEACFEQSLAQLTLGDFRGGWRGYEARWSTGAFAAHRRSFTAPLWLGDRPLDGKTILLHAEQGFGDTLQFVRYAPAVAALGARVILEVQPELAGLLAQLPGVAAVVPRGEPLPSFDCHCPLMSLPLAFATELPTIPARIPYLAAAQDRIARWRERLPAGRPRVGLAWAGQRTHNNDLNRSMRLATLRPLLARTNVQFVGLQHELSGEDAAFLTACSQLFQVGDQFRDFADTAAVISQLDLVIAVDSAVAHLAGALGKPLFLLLPFAADFRWMRERPDSPWYPTARLFRQPQFGDWASVVDALAKELD